MSDEQRTAIAGAIARVDTEKWGTKVPPVDHPFWRVYLAYADAVLAETRINSAERAVLRYALELAEDKMAVEPDEFAAVDRSAVTSLKRLAGEETEDPYPTESVIYEVVGDWGVDSADSAEDARAAVAKWLREHPKCGAYAQQRIVREWEDGSEFYGPWAPLPEEC
ncbi:hypothetical protein [Streptomyces sp. S1D4-14]|uniref:hypothetical protein n=1 Tax=Streptomyces sp. S1D4-14 TaxID=2594461 RepID=UPI001164F36C|nr:hypothetical protein [Streptomyces sp. S1D4-14]QDN64474.1 hypothetical protein FNV66_01170 [Streptomyces sp. S1D4-14]